MASDTLAKTWGYLLNPPRNKPEKTEGKDENSNYK